VRPRPASAALHARSPRGSTGVGYNLQTILEPRRVAADSTQSQASLEVYLVALT
jgi:hypothetical protein